MNFSEAQQAYQNLVRQKQSGQISQSEFSIAVQSLRIQTPDGTWWQIQESDGTWLWWNGTTWIPGQPGPVSIEPPKKKRSRFVSCLIFTAIFACISVFLLVAIGAGGYYAISQGMISQRDVLNPIGLGTGEISIINIADNSLDTELIHLDTESGSPETVDTQTIPPFEISGYGGIQPGEYELHISAPSGPPAGGVCRLQISSGDLFQFVAVPEGIAVTLEGQDAESADEIDMLTSDLCR
jgi:hypothetical protein